MTKLSKEFIQRCVVWVEKNGLYPQKGGAAVITFCAAMGISKETYNKWRKISEFADPIKNANAAFAERTEVEVVNALKRKALGYEYTSKRQEASPRKVIHYDPKTGRKIREEQGELITTKATQEVVVVPPDTGAAIFLLTNLAPEKWKNYQRAEIDANVNLTKPRDLTPEEAAELKKHLNENI